MSDKPKFPRIKTPKGKALWVKVSEPNTKYKPEGEYEATIVFAAEEVKDFLKQLDQLAQEAFDFETEALKPAQKKKAVCASPYAMEEDDEGNETGNVHVKAKLKASFVSKKTGKTYHNKVAVFDAAKNTVTVEGLSIGNGSTIRLSVEPRSYYVASSNRAGISLDLKALQILELKVYGGSGKASDYDFEEEGEGLSPADRGAPAGEEDF